MSAMAHAQCRISGGRLTESFRLPAFEQSRIFFAYAGELDQAFDCKGSECLVAIFSDTIERDDAILDSDAGDGFDGTDLVYAHHAPRVDSAVERPIERSGSTILTANSVG
jgi:hypothetical protein